MDDHQASFNGHSFDTTDHNGFAAHYNLEDFVNQNDASITQGLDSLGSCNNDSASCLDQRCLGHSSRLDGNDDINRGVPGDDINRSSEVSHHGFGPSVDVTMPYSDFNDFHPMSSQPVIEPLAALHSLTHNSNLNLNLNQNLSPNPNQNPSQNLQMGGQAFGTLFGQNHHHNHSHNNHHQMYDSHAHHGMRHHPVSTVDWNQTTSSAAPAWDAYFPVASPAMPISPPFHQTRVDECASMGCDSNCDFTCFDGCDEMADGVCCYEESCRNSYDMDAAVCCFDDECADVGCTASDACVDEGCHGAVHPCTDINCAGTVSTAPASPALQTPPNFHHEPNFGTVLSPSYQGQAPDSVSIWPEPVIKEQPWSGQQQTMGESDQYRCYWKSHGGEPCGLKFADNKELHDHCREIHLKDTEKEKAGYRCHWHNCKRAGTFPQRSKLERHMQTHTGFKPVQCTICNQHFSAKQALEQHMRTHSGEKPWKCTHPGCGQAFKQQSALTMHQRTHTGEKPLKCDICGKRFGESSNLSKHRRTHNIKGTHCCSLCGKDFHRLDQLRRHMRSTHKIGLTARDKDQLQAISQGKNLELIGASKTDSTVEP